MLAAKKGGIYLWDTRSGRMLQTLRGHACAISDIAFEAGGRRLLSVASNGTGMIWSVASEALEGEDYPTEDQVKEAALFVSFSPDQSKVAVTTISGRTALYDANSGLELASPWRMADVRTMGQRAQLSTFSPVSGPRVFSCGCFSLIESWHHSRLANEARLHRFCL